MWGQNIQKINYVCSEHVQIFSLSLSQNTLYLRSISMALGIIRTVEVI